MSKEEQNPFKKLETNEEVPESVKIKLMSSVRFAHLIGDFTELFTTRMASTAAKMMDVKKEAHDVVQKKVSRKSDQNDDDKSKE